MATDTTLPLDLMTMTIDAEIWLEEPKEEFCRAAAAKRMAIIRSLQHKFPHLTDEEADLAFVDAVIRCLKTGDYLRFDPDHLSLKGGFGLIALSCAEHLLRPLMVPAPTATKPYREIKVYFVPLPEEDDEGEHHIPKVCWCPDMTEALMSNDWVQKGLSCLSEEGRRAIHAYFWDELRGAELANVLGVSQDHAKKPVNRAMRQLRHTLLALAEEPHGSSF
jgi:Sigma-70, region 4